MAFRLAGGGTLRLATGDHVRVRRNDYRSRRAAGDPDLLNGYRGIIREITPGRGAVAEWRRAGPDGPVTELATLSPADIASGIVSYGTAMTVAAAQGSTASTALVYGPGLDAHALYVAMSRDRDTARLYLPRQLLEDGTDRARHGQPATPAEELQRAIDACARTLAADQPDRLVLTELGGVPSPIAQPPAVIPPESPPPAPPVPAWTTRPYGHHSDTTLTRLDHALRSDLPRLTTRDQRITTAQTTARAGNGPAATALQARRDKLAAAAAAAAEGLPAARSAAAAAAASYQQARQRHQNAQQHAAHGRAALLLAGLTPRQARDQLAATTRDLLTAQAREHETRTRAAQLAGDAAAAAAWPAPGTSRSPRRSRRTCEPRPPPHPPTWPASHSPSTTPAPPQTPARPSTASPRKPASARPCPPPSATRNTPNAPPPRLPAARPRHETIQRPGHSPAVLPAAPACRAAPPARSHARPSGCLPCDSAGIARTRGDTPERSAPRPPAGTECVTCSLALPVWESTGRSNPAPACERNAPAPHAGLKRNPDRKADQPAERNPGRIARERGLEGAASPNGRQTPDRTVRLLSAVTARQPAPMPRCRHDNQCHRLERRMAGQRPADRQLRHHDGEPERRCGQDNARPRPRRPHRRGPRPGTARQRQPPGQLL